MLIATLNVEEASSFIHEEAAVLGYLGVLHAAMTLESAFDFGVETTLNAELAEPAER
jgi:hypothetical protein